MENKSDDTSVETLFYEKLQDYINGLNVKFRNKFTIDAETYERIKEALAEESGVQCKYGARFKYWAKHTFEIDPAVTCDRPETLVCILTKKPVVRREELFSVILNCHRSIGHGRRDSTWKVVRDGYSWIHREAVNLLISLCPTCNRKAAHTRRLPGGSQFKKPVLALRFMTRVQLDLLDMTDNPDRDFKWVLHCRDHFTKFSWAFPLKSRQADEAAKILQNFIIPYFGAPRVLQSNSGKDYVAGVVAELTKRFPIVVVIRGKASHLLVKACIDRANKDLQKRLDSWLFKNKTNQWSDGLPQIVMAMNNTAANPGEKAPYEVLFGQKQNADAKLWKYLHEQGFADGGIINGDDENDTSTIESKEDEVKAPVVTPSRNVATKNSSRLITGRGSHNVVAVDKATPQSVDSRASRQKITPSKSRTVVQIRTLPHAQIQTQCLSHVQSQPVAQSQPQSKPQLHSQNQPVLMSMLAPPQLQSSHQLHQHSSLQSATPLPIVTSLQDHQQLQNQLTDKQEESYFYLLQHGEIVAKAKKTSFTSLHNTKIDQNKVGVYAVEAVLSNCQVFPVHVGNFNNEPIAAGQYVAWSVAETTKIPQCFAPPVHTAHHQLINDVHREVQAVSNYATRGDVASEVGKRRKAEQQHHQQPQKLPKLTATSSTQAPSVQTQQQHQASTYDLGGMESVQHSAVAMDRSANEPCPVSSASYYDCFAAKNGYYM